MSGSSLGRRTKIDRPVGRRVLVQRRAAAALLGFLDAAVTPRSRRPGAASTPGRPDTRRLCLREAGFRAMKIRIDTNRVDEGLAAVRAVPGQPGVRIAAGGMHHSPTELLRHLEDALGISHMDVVLAISMHRARTLAELAQQKRRHLTPHSWTAGQRRWRRS
ncbi:hypothetical protein OG613_02995 [Streptomyces sp. NBC_00015]|uniref:hypothetical protein n=1 Tax=Streptomyces sp. NBC_00015 TaxID=2903611 RepID=UPI003251E0E4